MAFERFARILIFCVCLLGAGTAVHADPPVLPAIPPPEVPCKPLICLQITDAREVAPGTWQFEFRGLNWSAFTDRPCPPTNPGCIDRTSAGEAAEGLVFVRSAALSTVPFRVLSVDPNGAPLGSEPVDETATVFRLAGGELGLDLDRGFVDEVTSIVDADTGDLLPAACYELVDPVAGLLTLDETAAECAPLTAALSQAEVSFTSFQGSSDAVANTWSSSLCTQDQIIWSQDPGVDPPLVIPPGDSNVSPSCPVTCEEKTSLGNNLDGFTIEVEDFQPGDRLVFNWYLLGDTGPIASGSPPTPTNPGTLAPSPQDPWGFSFGSFQIDRKPSCLAGDCDTVIVTTPPVTDPSLSCLVDGSLDRNSLPFDIYVSLGPAGTDPPCAIEPAVAKDDKGIERLVVRATSGSETDRITVQFRNLGTNRIDKSVQLPLQNASELIATDDLVGRYEVSGTCDNTATRQFFFLEPFTMGIPRRGDLAELPLDATAIELDEVNGGFALTGQLDGTGLDLADEGVEICQFFQVKDRDGNVRIFGSSGTPDLLSRHDGVLVTDAFAPQLACPSLVQVGTDQDGGGDCSVEQGITAVASDPAGGFDLTNDLDASLVTRSFGTTIDGQETAVQTATGVFSVGSPATVRFSAVDDSGQTATCASQVQVADDTLPLVECRLVPDGGAGGGGGPGNGGSNGKGPGGQGPPGQGGGNGPPNQLPNSHFYVVEFSATDNCQPDFGLTLEAAIDGITVTDGQPVQITTQGQPGVTSDTQGGRLHIQTSEGGVLTVTATDEAGNVATCQTDPIEP